MSVFDNKENDIEWVSSLDSWVSKRKTTLTGGISNNIVDAIKSVEFKGPFPVSNDLSSDCDYRVTSIDEQRLPGKFVDSINRSREVQREVDTSVVKRCETQTGGGIENNIVNAIKSTEFKRSFSFESIYISQPSESDCQLSGIHDQQQPDKLIDSIQNVHATLSVVTQSETQTGCIVDTNKSTEFNHFTSAVSNYTNYRSRPSDSDYHVSSIYEQHQPMQLIDHSVQCCREIAHDDDDPSVVRRREIAILCANKVGIHLITEKMAAFDVSIANNGAEKRSPLMDSQVRASHKLRSAIKPQRPSFPGITVSKNVDRPLRFGGRAIWSHPETDQIDSVKEKVGISKPGVCFGGQVKQSVGNSHVQIDTDGGVSKVSAMDSELRYLQMAANNSRQFTTYSPSNNHWMMKEAQLPQRFNDQMRIVEPPYIKSSSTNNGINNKSFANQYANLPSLQPPSLASSHHQQEDPVVAVSGKHQCSHCQMELGRGAAMIIESLNLFYHLSCFRCYVCNIALGNGVHGADVRVRDTKLHCQSCYSNDDIGLKFSQV